MCFESHIWTNIPFPILSSYWLHVLAFNWLNCLEVYVLDLNYVPDSWIHSWQMETTDSSLNYSVSSISSDHWTDQLLIVYVPPSPSVHQKH